MTKKSRQHLNILRTKRAFKMKKKTFFIIFKGLSLNQIKTIFLEGERLTLNILNQSFIAIVLKTVSFTTFRPEFVL